MVTRHYNTMACSINWFDIVDDYGNVVNLQGRGSRTWWNAYRFANVVSFEEANMRSIGQAVSGH
jgi:hypothetical protein